MPDSLMRRWFVVLIAIAVFAAGQEPIQPRLTPKIITATRQVTLFTGLEKQVLQNVQKKDKAALQAMLSDSFQVEMPDADPLAGDDWVDSIMGKDFTLKSFIVRQLSVLDLGDSAVVKYDRTQQATFKGRHESGESFVVDVWKKSGDSWRLANRYVAKIATVPLTPRIQPRPSGKE